MCTCVFERETKRREITVNFCHITCAKYICLWNWFFSFACRLHLFPKIFFEMSHVAEAGLKPPRYSRITLSLRCSCPISCILGLQILCQGVRFMCCRRCEAAYARLTLHHWAIATVLLCSLLERILCLFEAILESCKNQEARTWQNVTLWTPRNPSMTSCLVKSLVHTSRGSSSRCAWQPTCTTVEGCVYHLLLGFMQLVSGGWPKGPCFPLYCTRPLRHH